MIHCSTMHGLGVEIKPTRFADMQVLRKMGIQDDVLRMVRKIGLGCICIKQYDRFPDLIRQFLATARVYYSNEIVRNTQEGSLTFLIRGVQYKISLRDLYGIYGFEKEKTRVALPAQFLDVQAYWKNFGNELYDSKTSTQTDV
ncbi:hypothetical protein V5N11_034681 [Cardamine amara subsp. amara]|uniref:Arabidopsis retrotransposon Orf1 C-terminal domain-containing protein n=1 Tax=Cardamine amara subsp. amara TaxID=228776 RepID=A0ABD1ACA0_CARAN